jgi:hypothetical protein
MARPKVASKGELIKFGDEYWLHQGLKSLYTYALDLK